MRKNMLLVLAIILATGEVIAQNALTGQPNHIETSVKLSKEVTPDEIFIGITINEKDNKGKVSIEQQEKKMIQVLKSLGIDAEKALRVEDMSSSLKNNTIKKDDIFLSKRYTLKVSTASDAYEAIRSLNGMEIARVAIEKISISDSLEREVKSLLLTEAARKAQENAHILAQAVGSKAGKAIYIQNWYSADSNTNDRIMRASYTMAKNEEATTEYQQVQHLEIAKKSISISVNCKFALE